MGVKPVLYYLFNGGVLHQLLSGCFLFSRSSVNCTSGTSFFSEVSFTLSLIDSLFDSLIDSLAITYSHLCEAQESRFHLLLQKVFYYLTVSVCGRPAHAVMLRPLPGSCAANVSRGKMLFSAFMTKQCCDCCRGKRSHLCYLCI